MASKLGDLPFFLGMRSSLLEGYRRLSCHLEKASIYF
jgi:hypothetical protein